MKREEFERLQDIPAPVGGQQDTRTKNQRRQAQRHAIASDQKESKTRRSHPMFTSQHTRHIVAAWVASGLVLFAPALNLAQTQDEKTSDETTNVTVIVKEYDSGQPISQARITLTFSEAGGLTRLGKPRKITYNAKTDAQGRYKFTDINKGAITLVVTAAEHQTYGKDLDLNQDNQVFEVKLKKPQPLV
jgi:hypothetical protein